MKIYHAINSNVAEILRKFSSDFMARLDFAVVFTNYSLLITYMESLVPYQDMAITEHIKNGIENENI